MTGRMRLGTTLLAVGALACAAAGSALASVSPSAVSGSTIWAWAVARDTSHGGALPAKDRGSSSGEGAVLALGSTGVYQVWFPGIHASGGVAHVSVLGNSPRVCILEGWADFDGVSVIVHCHTRAEQPASAHFIVTYMASNDVQGRLAYVYDGQPKNTDYVPAADDNYNSKGYQNSVHRYGIGQFQVRLPGLASSKGHVQVSVQQDIAVCSVDGWGPSGMDLVVDIQCRRPSGEAHDTPFTLTFMQSLGLKGYGKTRVAYLWAEDSTATSYTPLASYRYSSPAGTPHVTRSGTGVYLVTLPGMPVGGAALVTAFGSGARRCIVSSIRSSGSPQQVGVRCFTFMGAPANTTFTLAYVR